MRGSPLWYRRTLARVAALEPGERPCVVVWHTDALPMPSASGLPSERLTAREWAKIVLRDRRINDHYSNARYFRHLSRRRITTAVAVASRAYQAYLSQEGIGSEFVPVGYHPSYGYMLELERDIDVLFLGEYPKYAGVGESCAGWSVRTWRLLSLGSNSLTKGFWGGREDAAPQPDEDSAPHPPLPGSSLRQAAHGHGNRRARRIGASLSPGSLRARRALRRELGRRHGRGLSHYLADEESRRRVTDAAYRFISEELPMERTYARLMELAGESGHVAAPTRRYVADRS